MNKEEILSMYSKSEDKLLFSKVLDKISISDKRNQVVHTDFLDLSQKHKIENLLKRLKKTNYLFYGGYNDAERVMLMIYPEKFYELEDVLKQIYINEIKVIRIKLPNELQGKYAHRDYLSGLMKLGIKREKFGDILVDKLGADILACEEVVDYTIQNLSELTRFSKSVIEVIKIEELRKIQINKEKMQIIIPSLRLDSIVSELAKMPRTKVSQIIGQEKVLVNFEVQNKSSKILKQNDIITIRGKGKFILNEVIGSTKKEKLIVNVEKYV